MDWHTLGNGGLAAMGIAAIGLPVQVVIGLALGMRRRVPVSLSILVPVAVLVLGTVATLRAYAEIGRSLVDPSDPGYAPWYAVVDRGMAASPTAASALVATFLVFPVALGAAVGALREERRGTLGPVIVATVGTLAGVVLLALGALWGQPWLAGPGLGLSILAVCTGGSLAAVRSASLSAPGAGVACMATAALSLSAYTAATLDLAVPDLVPDLYSPWSAVLRLPDHEELTRRVWLLTLVCTVAPAASTLPGLGALRVRATGLGTGLDVAATGALILGTAVALGWALVTRGAVGRLAGAHAAWVLASAPGVDVPRLEVLPPRVLVPGETLSRWIELRDGGGVAKFDAVGSLDEVGATLRRGDGLVLPPAMLAEDLYLLLADSRAGAVSVVGCGEVSAAHRATLTREPLYAVGRCGAFPLRLRVSQAMPNPRELIVLKDRLVQDGYDVIDLAELSNVAGRDVILRLQVDATVADLVATLATVQSASAVYLGWGVTLEGDDLAVGVEPGLRVAEASVLGAAAVEAPVEPPGAVASP